MDLFFKFRPLVHSVPHRVDEAVKVVPPSRRGLWQRRTGNVVYRKAQSWCQESEKADYKREMLHVEVVNWFEISWLSLSQGG